MMLDALISAARDFWFSLGFSAFEKNFLRATLIGLALLVLTGCIERWYRLPSFLRSRRFLHDVAYWFYYRLGIHYFLFLAATYAVLYSLLPATRVSLIKDLPFALQALVYFVVVDFFVYWIHRAQHRFAWLWVFHATHHSQTHLTFATSQRVHPVDHLIQDILMFIPLWLLGFNEAAWIPLYLASELTLALQHTRIPWTYGPIYRVLVSPVFHQYHHSIAPEHHHTNFAGIFSFWDRIFGTEAQLEKGRQLEFGVEGVPDDSLWRSVATPFQQLLRRVWRVPSELKTGNSNVRD